jgi:hypothetical protein
VDWLPLQASTSSTRLTQQSALSTMVSSSNGNSSTSSNGTRMTRSRAGSCDVDNDVPARATKSIRRMQYCTEIGLPRPLICSGCIAYVDASPSSKKGVRELTHSSRVYACRQPWRMDPTKPGTYDVGSCNSRYEKIREFLDAQGYSAARLDAVMDTPNRTILQQGSSPLSTLTPESNNTGNNSMETDGRTVAKERDDIELYTSLFSSMGHEFTIPGIPITHCIVTKSYLERLRNSDQLIKDLQIGCQYGRFAGGSSLMRALMAIAVTSCPALPLSQAANVIPLFVAGVLVDAGILDKAKVSAFSKSFPSETYMRDLVFSFAAENIYHLGSKIKGLFVFLSCDKGNKRGVGHFVKILSWYDTKTKSVMKQLLDIDASEGLTDDCGDAIAASMKKVGNIMLQGQTTDSGGGGVLDGLHRAIAERQLCRIGYLVASCSLHNLQLSVANPIKQTMGEGGLEKKNLMQLLHSIYDLQESMDRDVWKMHVTEAMAFLGSYGSNATPFVGLTVGDQQFAAKWELVKTFRQFSTTLTNKDFKRTSFKIPAPVLTRWWSVGETARVSWSAYLLLLRISQQVINSTASKPNKIASGLQPLMMEPELFSDLALVHCFHGFYVSPHFDWMQSATDLSGIPGFQAHNTLGRYYLLVQDLIELSNTISTTHPSFVDFQSTLTTCCPTLRTHQESKASRFVNAAIEAVNKHFVRWCNALLLPAALLSENPLATVVASVMLKKDLPPTIVAHLDSKVHDRTFNIEAFHNFLLSRVDDDAGAYPHMVLHIAQLLLDEDAFDLRDMDDDNYKCYKDCMYNMYLPLASQTQFVEAGVKEAKNVSPTDRSEMLRSAYAVARSARVHSIGDLRILKSTERIEALLHSALLHNEEHTALKAANEDYDERVEAIARDMRQEHFKQERVDKLKQDALAKVHKNKKENALQKKVGVDRTHAMEGLFPYGKLVKELHLDALKVELLHRGCTEEDIDKMKITARKAMLKEMECERLNDHLASEAEKEAATKAFKPLSGALFPVK